ncbi:nucleotidyltransferase family protein [Lysobacter sp. CFH 32150]|uniref:nucleotidyltransferase family protein n=1 Tax=Lysobacter sp. CFH 32150 TaxID=2927128 RepID=UPI001FA7B5B2|nr:nucleotidyltransferase family protein [Lysobacter sp. CFH 32150]MCI4568214.1 nucleotidyltransferase family protein [Lysobacter sp. CFH 32150]
MSEMPHAAVVLAAGGSRRLGMPKQLLTRDGETLLHRAVRLAAMTHPQRLVVVLGAERDAFTTAAVGVEGEVLFNLEWEQGLSSSLRCAARALQGFGGRILLLGCDQPALEPAHLSQLLDGAASVAFGCAATVHGTHLGQPAVIPNAMLQSAPSLEGDTGFGYRLSGLPESAIWCLFAPELQLDVDTPADVELAVERGVLDAAL